MSATNTLTALESFCKNNSGHPNQWQGNKSTYAWNVGREATTGPVNGVVRKLAGVDAAGKQIWVVAGSFKIAQDGTILRFTGLSKKQQTVIAGVGNITQTAKAVAAATEEV